MGEGLSSKRWRNGAGGFSLARGESGMGGEGEACVLKGQASGEWLHLPGWTPSHSSNHSWPGT